MSKKDRIIIRLQKRGLKGIKTGCALNQHSGAMRDKTKYSRKQKHRHNSVQDTGVFK